MAYTKNKITQEGLGELLNELVTVNGTETLNVIESSSRVRYGLSPLSTELSKVTSQWQGNRLTIPICVADFGFEKYTALNSIEYPSALLSAIQSVLVIARVEPVQTYEEDFARTKLLLESHEVKAVAVRGLEKDDTPMRTNYWSNIHPISATCKKLGVNLLILTNFEYGKELRMEKEDSLSAKSNDLDSLNPIFHISEYEESYSDYEGMIEDLVEKNGVTADFIKMLYKYTGGNAHQSRQVVENIFMMEGLEASRTGLFDNDYTDHVFEFNRDVMLKYLEI